MQWRATSQSLRASTWPTMSAAKCSSRREEAPLPPATTRHRHSRLLRQALAGVTIDVIVHNAGSVNATREAEGMNIFGEQKLAAISMERMNATRIQFVQDQDQDQAIEATVIETQHTVAEQQGPNSTIPATPTRPSRVWSSTNPRGAQAPVPLVTLLPPPLRPGRPPAPALPGRH